MPLNLISDRWIPVRLRDDTQISIAPWEMARPDILRPDWPRADLNIACYELLIGLVRMADPPADAAEWKARAADPERLRARLEPFRDAFELTGTGPCFLQDLEPLDGAPNRPDMLFIDSAGGQTARNNADLMVHRDRYPTLAPALAAMALYTLQAFAPSGGAGNRTSMRGGGPMVTLVDPGDGLWSLVWANVPYGEPAAPGDLPWMRPTRISQGANSEVYPAQAHPVEAFFGMPRRLRLIGEAGQIAGVIQKPYGTNYAGWIHPLTPYYRQKPGAELLPVHPKPALFGYRNWLGVVAAQAGEELTRRAETVETWSGRGGRASLIVSGWAMDNMKPRSFLHSVQPLVALPAERNLMLISMIGAADQLSLALRAALGSALSEGEVREALREEFFARSQADFDARLTVLVAGDPPEGFARGWIGALRGIALDLFDDATAVSQSCELDATQQEALTSARSFLLASFNGRTKYGRAAFDLLELAALVEKEEPRMTEKEHGPGAIVRRWWAGHIAPRDSGAARGLAARLRRARSDLDLLAEPEVHDLARALNLRDAGTLALLVRTLAEVRADDGAPLAKRLGPGQREPVMSQTRFRRLIGTEGTALAPALRRALAMAEHRCNVARLGADLLSWNERTRSRWTFEYYGTPVPASLAAESDQEETPA